MNECGEMSSPDVGIEVGIFEDAGKRVRETKTLPDECCNARRAGSR